MPMSKFDEPIVPTEQEVRMARESRRQIGAVALDQEQGTIGLQIGGRAVPLPHAIARVTLDLITQVAEGKAVAIVPLDKEVSPQEAASLLNVSRPYATKLFSTGAIPSRKVGSHWRALVRDVLAYREREEKARRIILDELVAEAQHLKMGY